MLRTSDAVNQVYHAASILVLIDPANVDHGGSPRHTFDNLSGLRPFRVISVSTHDAGANAQCQSK
jgi:hypothetical protein